MSPLERAYVQALVDERLREARAQRSGRPVGPRARVNRPWRKPRD
jgi:hypothetical protein